MKKSAVFCIVVLAIMLGVLLVNDVLASSYYLDPDIERRIQNQYDRIEAGISSGQLTREEARTLKNNLHHIQDEAIALQADGRFSSGEKQRLENLLDRNGEMIREKRQNPITALSQSAGLERDHEIRDIIARQQLSINAGVRSGQLTTREAQTLNSNLNYVRDEEARWKTYDGRLSEDARDRLIAMLEDNGNMIRNKKNNPVSAFGQTFNEIDHSLTLAQRVQNQQRRIDQGIRSGNLTREEARILRSNLEYIIEKSKGARKDGVITDGERRRLNAMLDQNSYMIQDKKTNPIRQSW